MVAGTALVSGAVFPPTARADSGVVMARVVAAEPVYRSVTRLVPVEACEWVDEPVAEPRRQVSFTGPIVGAIIGGAIGNAVGHNKTNKKVGTAVGAILGGSIGRDLQRRHRTGSQLDRWESRRVCRVTYRSETHEELEGYDVTYRYAEETYTARLDHDPGSWLPVRVQVTPV